MHTCIEEESMAALMYDLSRVHEESEALQCCFYLSAHQPELQRYSRVRIRYVWFVWLLKHLLGCTFRVNFLTNSHKRRYSVSHDSQLFLKLLELVRKVLHI